MKHLIALPVLLALLVTACSGPTPNPDPDVAPKVSDQTRVVTEDTRKSLSSFTFTNAASCQTSPDPIKTPNATPATCTGKMVFSKSTPYLAGLAVGNLMVSPPGPNAPYGYLQKVKKITTSGDQVTVETEAASLDEALIEGQFQQEGILNPSDLSAMSLRQGVTPRGHKPGQIGPQAESFGFDINTVLFDADDNSSTTNDQVRLKGNFNLSVDNGLSYNLKWKKVLGVPIYPKGIYVRMAYGFKQSASVSVEADLNVNFEKEVELAKYTFSPITFFIGPVPVVLVPTVRITADMKGNISAKMSFGASESVSAVAGFEYNDGFKNISDFSHSFNKYADISGVKGQGEAGLNIQGEILLYGLVGPYARVRGNVVLDAAIPRDPVWTLQAGLKGYVGIHADLLVKTLNYDTQIFDLPLFEIGKSENQKPTVGFKSPLDGQTYSQNIPVTNLCLQMDDLESTSLNVRISSNLDGELVNTSVSRANFGVYCLPARSFGTLGVRTLTATVTDKGGQSGSATRSIEIVNNPPSVLILKPSNGASVAIDTPVLLKGTLVDPNEPLDCTRFKWSSSVQTDLLPANNCGDVTATFKTEGTRTLKLEARDSQNALGSTEIQVTVKPKPANVAPDVVITQPEVLPNPDPTQPAVYPKLPPVGDSMTVKGTLLDPDSAQLTYKWKFSYTQSGLGPYIKDIQTQTVSLVGGKFSPTLTFRPSDVLEISGGGEFKCYKVDYGNLFLLLEASDGVNKAVIFSVPMQKGCVG